MSSRPAPRPGQIVARRRALTLLKDDHRRLERAFDEFDTLQLPADLERMRRLVAATLARLARHAEVEAAVIYAAGRASGAADDPVDEAEVEHAAMAALARLLREADPTQAKFAVRFKVLGEYLRHHVDEEEGVLFAALERAPLAWPEIAARLEPLADDAHADD